MTIMQFGVAEGSNTVWRAIGSRGACRLAVILLLTTAYVFLMRSNAFASDGLSSVILSSSEPGLVAAPLGTYDGPITQSNVNAVMGSTTDATSALGQSLADGDVTGYIRSWDRQPSNGDAVVIAAFEFTNTSEENSFVDSLDADMRAQSGSEPLAVPRIWGASGAALLTSASGTPVSEYVVSFAKGDTAFQVGVASSSGDLTSADAVSVANRQFAVAPNTPAGTSGTTWQWSRVVPLAGIPFCIAIILVARRRKYPTALSGLPPRVGYPWDPSSVLPSRPSGAYAAPVGARVDAGASERAR